ncbi:MBOAT family O-acyltransferase [Clostridium sp. cel8]|uniref:MBOAT family O-acyltransferase n=2 Tax=unclassified Clostridium TaxID=2614128 RepID=UPI001FABCAE3|nr:MBOAT family O-acyltransferase [Clostridium sp. cel8]
MSANPKYLILLVTCTMTTYIGGLLIGKSNKIGTKKLFVFLSMSSNLGILFLFKYYNFFTSSLIRILSNFGISISIPSFDVIMPIGLSFYTFQALSYIMDVYRGDIEVELNPFKYALFVSFFPQLLSGPIQKSKNFMHQIYDRHYFDYTRVKNGLLLMLWGYFQKTMFADKIAPFINTVYNNPANHRGLEVILATVLFAFQLYCDFSSYSDIAIGAAEVMGFKLSKNFERPYFAKSIREFWKRWHISLTSWFMDYLYFPLGGSRCSKLRTYFNVMVVFLVSGIWHGAGFTFIIWGGLHGTYYIIGKVISPIKRKLIELFKIRTNVFSYKLIQITINFVLIDFAWLFFRANSFKGAIILIKNMFYFNPYIFIDGSVYKLGVDSLNFSVAMFSLFTVLIVNLLQRNMNLRYELSKQNLAFRWFVYFASLLIILIFGTYGSETGTQQFIYSQF